MKILRIHDRLGWTPTPTWAPGAYLAESVEAEKTVRALMEAASEIALTQGISLAAALARLLGEETPCP